MSKTPKTDKLLESLRIMCKKAGYNVKSARQVSLDNAKKLVKNAQDRILAREFKKIAEIRRQIRKAKRG